MKQVPKLVDSDNVIAGVHGMGDEIRASLQSKHPGAAEAEDLVLMNGDVTTCRRNDLRGDQRPSHPRYSEEYIWIGRAN